MFRAEHDVRVVSANIIASLETRRLGDFAVSSALMVGVTRRSCHVNSSCTKPIRCG